MRQPSPLCAFVLDQLSTEIDITHGRMFGCDMLKSDDVMFAIEVDDELHFKVDDTSKQKYIARGQEPFSYQARGKTISISFYTVPADVIEDTATLIAWAQEAITAAKAAKKKKPNRTSSKASKARKSARTDNIAPTTPISDVPNLGQKSALVLENIGIKTFDDLKRTGAAVPFAALKRANTKNLSKNLLWALEAALSGRIWTDIPPATKARLLREVDDLNA